MGQGLGFRVLGLGLLGRTVRCLGNDLWLMTHDVTFSGRNDYCSQYFLRDLMDMSSLLRAILGTIRNYKKDLYVRPCIRLILTVIHVVIIRSVG